MIIGKIRFYLKFYFMHRRIVFFQMWVKSSRFIFSDILYLKVYYYLKMGEKLQLNPPNTFNQKLQWLKLNIRNPEYTELVDKLAVRDVIRREMGEEYLIPLLGVWDSFDEIDFDKLPNQFILKATHDSGSYTICKDKLLFDKNVAENKLSKCLKQNFYYILREYQYKNVKPKLIAEQYMYDESGAELRDYKFYCFNGIPKVLLIASGRASDMVFDFYDMNLNRLRYVPGKHGVMNDPIVHIPSFDKMKEIAKKLTKNMIHVRLDLYNIRGRIYFGEFTFHDGGGMNDIPKEWDLWLGDLIRLPID